jgi:hypothetical protein
MAEYTIQVLRGPGRGLLVYANGSLAVKTTCWWDLKKKIPPGTYTFCYATRMKTKLDSVTGQKRPGIYIPCVPGFEGIFIHEGKNAAWSDGCIVARRKEFMKIWNDITPKNGWNVTVVVKDGVAA